MLSKDSKEKRERQKREERMNRAEGELKKGISKHKRKAQERHRENRKLKNKSGREILYSASPGRESTRYHDPAFVSRKKTPEIFSITDNDETENTTKE